MSNVPIDPPSANPAFHPHCKIFSIQRLQLRAKALFESGLALEENAIVCALAVVVVWPEPPEWPTFNFSVCPPENSRE